MNAAPRYHGFTLIEVLVALAVLALMATLAWRGLDGMLRAREQLGRYGDELSVLQSALAQWQDDLDSIQGQPELPGLDWNGRVLRLVRHDQDHDQAVLRVVSWSLLERKGAMYWVRTHSPPINNRSALLQAWQQAVAVANQQAATQQVPLVPVASWQLYYFRGNAWSNPQSSANDTAQLPDGVRLVLNLSSGAALDGRLTLDWVRPGFGSGP